MRLSLILVLALLVTLVTSCYTPANANSLDGTGWRLQSWSVTEIDPADHNLTLRFEDGRLGGTSAVNSYGGPYKAAAGEIEIGELVSTLMAGSDEAMRAEAAYLDRLQQAEKYTLSGETLTLMGADGAELLVFAREK